MARRTDNLTEAGPDIPKAGGCGGETGQRIESERRENERDHD